MMSESESMENLQSAVDKNHGTARGITAQEGMEDWSMGLKGKEDINRWIKDKSKSLLFKFTIIINGHKDHHW